MISQLIYLSNRNTRCSDLELEHIFEKSKSNNASADITGILVSAKGKFLQVIEGDIQSVLELYERIKLDNRHSNVKLISIKENPVRNFPEWRMGHKKYNDQEFDRLGSIEGLSENEVDRFKNLFEGIDDPYAISLIRKFS